MDTERLLQDRTIQVSDRPYPLDDKGFNKNDLYRLTLSGREKRGGDLDDLKESIRRMVLGLVTGEEVDLQMLFEAAYGLGTKIDRNNYWPKDYARIIERCTEIYQRNLQELEERTEEGKPYLPIDTVTYLLSRSYPNRLKLAQEVYLSGLAAGFLLHNGLDSVSSYPSKRIKDHLEAKSTFGFVDLLARKRNIVERLINNPGDFVASYLDVPKIETVDDLETANQILQRLLPSYLTGRVQSVVEGKKKAKTYKPDLGKIVSVWAADYEDPNFSLARALLANEEKRGRVWRGVSVQLESRLTSRIRKISQEWTKDDSCLVAQEMVLALVPTTGEEVLFEYELPPTIIDSLCEKLANQLPVSFPLDKEELYLALQRDVASVVNGTLARLASKIGKLSLTNQLLEKDLNEGKLPQEAKEMINRFLLELEAPALPASPEALYRQFIEYVTQQQRRQTFLIKLRARKKLHRKIPEMAAPEMTEEANYP